MVNKITVICDRCKRVVHGYVDENITAGFYHVYPGSAFERYRRNNENDVCEMCMWSDEKFLVDYPWMRGQAGNV